MLGRPFGAPNEPAFQRKVLLAALKLLEATAGPVLQDFPEDAPASTDGNEGFACPVSFARADQAVPDLPEALQREIAQLAPWHDLALKRRGRSTVGLSGLRIEAIADFIASYLGDAPLPNYQPESPLGVALKRACDDLKAYYYEACAAQPGNLSASAIQDWFWRDTAAGRAFLELKAVCLASADKSVKLFGSNSLVPRAVQHSLVQH